MFGFTENQNLQTWFFMIWKNYWQLRCDWVSSIRMLDYRGKDVVKLYTIYCRIIEVTRNILSTEVEFLFYAAGFCLDQPLIKSVWSVLCQDEEGILFSIHIHWIPFCSCYMPWSLANSNLYKSNTQFKLFALIAV